MTTASVASGLNPKPMIVVADYDDTTALASWSSASEYDNVALVESYQGIQIEIVPSVTPAYYQSGAFTGYGTDSSCERWLDMASPGIDHFGIKGYIPADSNTTYHAQWDVAAEYYVSFRNVR